MRKVSATIGVLAATMAFGAQAETLTIYTSVPTEIMSDIETAFEDANPDIDLKVFRSGTGKITARIATEREAGGIRADVVWVADFSYYDSLKADNLLMQYTPQNAENVPAAMRDEEGYYTGARMISMVIAYNTEIVDEPPQGWNDLRDARWEDQIAMANPLYSGAALDTVGALTMNYGLEYYRGLRSNGATAVRGNSGTARKIASGEYPVGITLDYIVRGQRANGANIDLVYPKDGAVAIPSPIGIIKGTDNAEDAQTFVDFAVSEKGQTALRDLGSFIPVLPSIESPEDAPALGDLAESAISINWNYIGTNSDFLRDRFTSIMLD